MFPGLNHLNNCVRTLVDQNDMLDERLFEASDEFLALFDDVDHWPYEYRERAYDLQTRLTAKGKVMKTLNGMDVVVATELAGDIFDLLMDATRAEATEMQII